MTAGWRFRLFSALLPVLGLALLIARGELARHGRSPFRLPIAGFDPRDLISGHYLNYRYELDWQGESTCGSLDAQRPALFEPNCCVCLTRGPSSAVSARQLGCGEVQSCDGWLRSSELAPPRRYYVPEERALELQAALGQRSAAVDVTASASGEAAVSELYLDGRPWREVIGAP